MSFAPLRNDTFLRACMRLSTPHTPVWLMRQAGRYLPEYRETRAKAGSFMGLATNVDYATEVTLQPLERYALDAAILFAPVGELVPQALKIVKKGGTVVCGGIHMSDIPSFPYEWLWQERTICSVANMTRRDGEEVRLTPTEWAFLELLARNIGRLVPREQILREVWGTGYLHEHHYLRVYAAQLRRKLEDDPSHPRHLLTTSGLGYTLEP